MVSWWVRSSSVSPANPTGITPNPDDDFMAQARALYDAGTITTAVYERITMLGHESDLGWDFHHHHTHFSYE